MAGFKFDEVDQFVQESDNKINFLKLQDDGWYATVRFMYGPGEVFEGHTVHNVSEDPRKPKYVPCLREMGQPLETCPLCVNGSKINAQFFIPVYVMSITSVIRGVEQKQEVNQVMLFQRGSTFKGTLQSVIRQADGPAIVNTVFNLVRNGKAGDMKTNYSIEKLGTDNVGLEQLPPRTEYLGSYILPNVSYEEMMEKYVNKTPTATPAADIQPRTLSANTFAGNTVVGGAGFQQASTGFSQVGTGVPSNAGFQPINANQAPVQAPNVPF